MYCISYTVYPDPVCGKTHLKPSRNWMLQALILPRGTSVQTIGRRETPAWPFARRCHEVSGKNQSNFCFFSDFQVIYCLKLVIPWFKFWTAGFWTMAWGPNDLLPKPCQIQQKYLELVDMALPKEGLASPLTSLGVVAALGVFLKGLVL